MDGLKLEELCVLISIFEQINVLHNIQWFNNSLNIHQHASIYRPYAIQFAKRCVVSEEELD